MANETIEAGINSLMQLYPANKRTCCIIGNGKNGTGCILFSATQSQIGTIAEVMHLNSKSRETGETYKAFGVCQTTGKEVTVDGDCTIDDTQFRAGLVKLFDKPIDFTLG